MDVWRDVRLKARQRHTEARDKASSDAASELVKHGLKLAGLQTDTFAPGTVYGDGVLGALEREDGFVRLAANLDSRQRAVVAAHELGHFVLHDEGAFMIRSTEAGFGGQPVETGSDRVVAYSPRERREVQADIFAQEFLLPADKLRRRLIEGRERPSSIANDLGLPVEFVRMQSIRALLLPPLTAPAMSEEGPSVTFDLDPEQREAAEWDDRPLILDAGPGTGKTRTLISRIRHLLAQGEPPSSILALTFSNKAAAEMIERVEKVNAVAAPLIWVGTFHAYGLELLRLHCHAAGLPADFKVPRRIRTVGAAGKGARRASPRPFPELVGPDARTPPDPTRYLPGQGRDDIRPGLPCGRHGPRSPPPRPPRTSSGPRSPWRSARYTRSTNAPWRRTAASISATSSIAQSCCSETDRTSAPPSWPSIAMCWWTSIRTSTLPAPSCSTRSPKAASVSGSSPTLGSQSIAFAAPLPRMRWDSPTDTPVPSAGSSRPITDRARRWFGSSNASVRRWRAAPKPAATWKANRGRVGFVDLFHAPDLASEATAIRGQIERLKGDGIGYEDQAILATTHLCLARFGRALQDLGVPVLYLGDLFERSEIRDLLSLVSLGSDRGGVGLGPRRSVPPIWRVEV
jgi:DNA helicase-2/ATP-dependent DNA helicase PcrA